MDKPDDKKEKSNPRSAGQIIERGEPKWLVRIFLGRNPKTGKRRYHNHLVHGTNKAAQKYLRTTLTEIDLGTFVEPAGDTLEDYLTNWLESAAKPRLAASTYWDYKYLLEKHVVPKLGEIGLADLRTLDIQKRYSEMQAAGLSARTVRYAHTVLSSALKQAVNWGMIIRNPAELAQLPRQARKEMSALNQQEALQFLKAAADCRWNILFMIAIQTGMRPEEYLALRWQDLALSKEKGREGLVTVQRTLVWRNGKDYYFGETKTRSSRRSIPLSASLAEALIEHRRRQAAVQLKAGENYQRLDLVFATKLGGPLMHRNLVRRHFKPILKRAGLSQSVRLYDLRHTCATLLLLAGVNPKVVSERLGHATVAMTLDVYSHVLPSMQENATEKLENMLSEKTGTL